MNIWKKTSLVLSVCLVGFSLMSDVPTETYQADSDAALDTIAIINQINYSVEVVRTYNNVIALEEEYEKISADNLNLNCIRDEESLQLIREILNTLNSMRMNDRVRKWYRRVLTRDLKGAKIIGMAKMATTVTSSLVNGSGGFWSRVGQLFSATALAGVESIADYKKAEHEFQGQFEDKEFELDTDKLNKLHEMNDKLLEFQWKLVQKYHLDDRLRVTGKEIKSLVNCLKTSDRKNAHRQLKPMQRKFEVYPIYWYYRAAMALSVEEYDDAISSCEHFDRINRSLFRTDQMAADTAMIKIAAMMMQRPAEKQFEMSEKETIKKGLETICTQNYNSENSDESIFCTSVYLFALDDVESASMILDALMSKLTTASNDELREYCDLFTSPKEKRKVSPPNMVYLAQCRMLRLAIDQKRTQKVNVERLKDICERETTCSLEKLFYFGELRIKDIWKVAKKDVEKINLFTSKDCVVVEIPITWFLLGNLNVKVEMLKDAKVVRTLHGDLANRSHVISSPILIQNSKDMAYVHIAMPVQNSALIGCDGARLHLNHVSWPVDLVYATANPIKGDNVIFVPVRVEHFMGKALQEDVMPDPKQEAIKRFQNLKKMAEDGDFDAQRKLGICYYNGDGVKEDKREAVKLFRKLAEQGDVFAQCNMGISYFEGGGVAEDKKEAVKWFLKAAEQGDVEAQIKLGLCYYEGSGVAENKKEAVKWFRKAAEQENTHAQFNLGNCYYNGWGVDEDKKEAVKWYRKAAVQGDSLAQIRLGFCYQNGDGVAEDKTEAVKWYRMAAEQGNTNAQLQLAFFYEKGDGVAEDKSEAVKWFRKAAEQGDADAQFIVGGYYHFGDGVAENKSEAVKWYRKAAEQGLAEAQFNLGNCYYNGWGVDEDKKEAVKWYRKAAEQGYAAAQFNLGFCYDKGYGVAEDKKEAVKWYRKAAEQGDAEACNNLGVCYENGYGVAKNQEEADKWYAMAKKMGYNPAIPEPSSGVLVLLGAASLALRRKAKNSLTNN